MPSAGPHMLRMVLALLAGGASAAPVPAPPLAIGAPEGTLNIVAWEGYTEDDWVRPFEAASGCKVNRKYAGSSDEMVALLRQGGGSQFDLVSASGDATLRLIAGHNVQPLNLALLTNWKDITPDLQSPGFNTIGGVHYGLSYEWGPNLLIYSASAFPTSPESWSVLYDPARKTDVTVPDNPIQIADAALYLSHTRPELGITDPYELTQPQLDAVVALLQKQHPLIRKYWSLASDEIDLFKSGDVTVGSGWPYQTITLQAAGVKVADTIPAEGATGWADSWMVSSHAPHPNCAYAWMNYVTSPLVQAKQALFFGETPANVRACPELDRLKAGSCHRYHADAPAAYIRQIRFWRTPLADCGDGRTTCSGYIAWQQAWQRIKG